MLDKKKLNNKNILCSIFQLLCQTNWLIVLFAIIIFTSACSRRYHDVPAYMAFDFGNHENRGVGRFKSSLLAEQMAEYYRGSQPGPIGVATFVNVDDLHASSTFGRIFAEQIISELSMQGFDVVELRHSDVLQFLDTTGEFALSRDVAVLKPERELGGIVVGTYAVSPVRVYVNARLVEPSTSHVLAVGSVEMGKTNEIARLLRGGSVGATLERIPVKHLGFNSMPMAMNPYMQQAQNWQMEERMGMAAMALRQQGQQGQQGQQWQQGDQGQGNLGQRNLVQKQLPMLNDLQANSNAYDSDLNLPSKLGMAEKPQVPQVKESKPDTQTIELKKADEEEEVVR